MDGFAEEPFVHAAAQFLQYDLTNLLDLLTQAVEKGASIGFHVQCFAWCIYTCTCALSVVQCTCVHYYRSCCVQDTCSPAARYSACSVADGE